MTKVVVPLEEIVGTFHTAMQAFAKSLGYPQQEREISREIIHAAFDDAVNDRLIWAKNTDQFGQLLEKHYSLKDDDQNYMLFDDNVWRDIQLRICEIIDYMIPRRSWNVYTVCRIGRDLLITQEEDYRIIDWERRMASGEWCERSTVK